MNKVVNILKSYTSFLLTTHVNADGDGVGSVLALGESLELLQKDVYYAIPKPIPEHFSFLPNFHKINKNIDNLKSVDVLVILDAPNIERLEGIDINSINFKEVVRIDHHKGNSDFEENNYAKTNYPSTTCLVFEVLKYNDFPINKNIANALYVGLLTDTGSFRFNNTTEVAFEVAKELVKLGAEPYFNARMVYEMDSLPHLKLLGLALLRLEIIGKLGFSYLYYKDFLDFNAKEEDSEGIVDYLRKEKDIEAVLFLRELENGNWKGSLRSKNHIDVRKIAEIFNGGGHKEASGFKTELSKDEILKIVLEELNKQNP